MTMAEIQRAGANARARGESQFSNPYLRSDAMPAVTGEEIEVWVSKARAWDAGWRMEDAIRS